MGWYEGRPVLTCHSPTLRRLPSSLSWSSRSPAACPFSAWRPAAVGAALCEVAQGGAQLLSRTARTCIRVHDRRKELSVIDHSVRQFCRFKSCRFRGELPKWFIIPEKEGSHSGGPCGRCGWCGWCGRCGRCSRHPPDSLADAIRTGATNTGHLRACAHGGCAHAGCTEVVGAPYGCDLVGAPYGCGLVDVAEADIGGAVHHAVDNTKLRRACKCCRSPRRIHPRIATATTASVRIAEVSAT